MQVAVVDADHAGFQSRRAVQLGPVVYFDQHVHAKGLRRRLQLAGLRVGHRGHDDQDAVGLQRPRLGHLPGVVEEILAQAGQVGRVMCGGQIGIVALETGGIGQHRQAGGPPGLIGAGQRGRVEIGADQTLGGAGFLDLGNQAIAGQGGGAQGLFKPARGGGGGGGGVKVGQRPRGLARGNFGQLVGLDAVEDGGHGRSRLRGRDHA